MKKDRVLFVNITKQCNVECTRCYLTKENRSKKDLLPIPTLEKLVDHSYFKENNVTVVWEGGEATLVGENALEERIKVVKSILPHAKQTMVTNLLNFPNWMIRITKEYFDNQIETTFALGKKFTLDGSREKYLEKFKASLKKVNANGIICPVNIELNKETHDMGTQALVDFMKETEHKYWEFDLSVDFEAFLRNPIYNEFRYPILPGTITFKQFSQFIIDLNVNHEEELKEIGFESTVIKQAKERSTDKQTFNVQRESDFITLNPDGFVTTNPLFTDMPATYIGNINNVTANEIFNSSVVANRIRYERKRTIPCLTCEFYKICGGGASHAPLKDNSGECAGGYLIWKHYE